MAIGDDGCVRRSVGMLFLAAASVLSAPAGAASGVSSDAGFIEECARDLRALAQTIAGEPVDDFSATHFTGFDRFGGASPEEACNRAVAPKAYSGPRSVLTEAHVQPVCQQCTIKVHFHCADELIEGKAMLAERTMTPFAIAPNAVAPHVGDTVVPFEGAVRAAVEEVDGHLVVDRFLLEEAIVELHRAQSSPALATGRFDDFCLVSVSE